MERRKSLSALGLREGASDDDIKKAFKQLALKYHPDKNQETGAKEKFQEVNRAYQYLTKGNTHFEDEDEIIIPFDLLLAMFGMRHRATPFGFPFGFSPFHHYDDNHGFCGDPRFFDSSEEEDDYFYYSGQRATNQSQRKPPSKPWSNVPKAEPKEETKTSKKKKNKSTRKKARAAAAEERKSESPGPGEKRPPSRTPKADPAKPGPQSVPPEATCRNEDVSGSSSTDNRKTEDKGGNKASQATLNQQSQQNNTVIQQPQKKKTKKQLLAEQNRREKEMATMTADLQKAQTEKAEKEQLRQEERRVREEKERIAEEKRQQELQEEEERKMEEKRRLEELRRLEEQRRLEEIRQAEEQRRLEEEKRLAEKQRKEEERRLAQIEEQRCLHEQMVLEEERICREQRFAESQRKLRAQLSSKEHVNEENVSPHPSVPAASPLMKKMFKVPGQEGEELLHEVKKDAQISALPKGFQAGVYNPYVDDWGDVMPDETPAPKLGTRVSNQPLPASQKSWGEQMDELDDLDDLGGVTGSHQPLRPLSNAGWTTAGRNGHVKATPGRQPRPGYSSLVPQSHREEEEMLEQAKYASAQASNAQSPVNNRFLDMDDIDDITIPVPENIENTNPRGKINHFSGAKPKTGSWHSNVKIPATNSTRLTAASYTLNTQNSSTERQSNWMNNGYGGTGSKFERRPVQPLNQTSGFNGPVLSNGGHYQKNMTQPVSSDSANKSQQQAYGNVRNHQMLHGARNAYGHPQSNYQRTVPHWGDSREFEPIRRPTHATRFSQPSPWQPNVPSLNQPQMFYNSAYSIPPPSTLQPMYTYRHF